MLSACKHLRMTLTKNIHLTFLLMLPSKNYLFLPIIQKITKQFFKTFSLNANSKCCYI